MPNRSARGPGADVRRDGVRFRVWAPRHRRVELVLEPSGRRLPMSREAGGWFSRLVPDAGPGTRYRYRLDGRGPFPDPASRFQPEGPHGASEVVDPSRFRWTDRGWKGLRLPGQVFYEMHVGTFTPEGTFAAAAARLPDLAELGVTAVEVMPVADFPGTRGWGYDGVCLFAPYHVYGSPDDFRAFVDRAHATGLGVLLDVVYNHLGPDGNYLTQFGPYFAPRKNDWGDSVNFDGPGSASVREFFLANAESWIREYHMDGLRVDATQAIHDDSEPHILAELTSRARAAGRPRAVLLVAEHEPQLSAVFRPAARGGYGFDAVWNDDFHHAAIVALTGRREAYYTDYTGSPQEILSSIRHGYLYQGQHYAWQKKTRGMDVRGVGAMRFVHYLENHDQVANTARGLRLVRRCDPARVRAMTAILLLGPQTPMLFQGQEFGATAPFLYFIDHNPELASQVLAGRKEFLRQFPSLASPAMQAALDNPALRSTFERCRLDASERARHAAEFAFHRDLLRLRRMDPVFRAQRGDLLHGAVLGPAALLLRWTGPRDGERLLLANLGADHEMPAASEPLLAPPEGSRWELLWGSEDPRYGGDGIVPLDLRGPVRLKGESAVVMRNVPEGPDHG